MLKPLIILLLMPFLLLSQNYGYFAGARSTSMANASVALTDIWGIYHNQAVLALLQKPMAAGSFEKRFFLSDLNLAALAIALPLKNSTIGASLNYFGFDLFNQTRFGLAYSQKVSERLALGAQLSLWDQSNRKGLQLLSELGLLLVATENLKLGVHVFNPFYRIQSLTLESPLAIQIRAGISCELNSHFTITSELLGIPGRPSRLSTGFEYEVFELFFRAGFALMKQNNGAALGLGWKVGNIQIDLSWTYLMPVLSNSNISIQYQW